MELLIPALGMYAFIFLISACDVQTFTMKEIGVCAYEALRRFAYLVVSLGAIGFCFGMFANGIINA